MTASNRRRRSDTREKIQAVALELFAEQGYDRTSLREIAERLEVTKAALYYHFKTKEAIVASLFDDFLAAVDEIIAWGQDRPPTTETRRELIRRYAEIVRGPWADVLRVFQDNQTAVRELKVQEAIMTRFVDLARLLSIPDASPARQLKSRIALLALQAGAFLAQDIGTSQQERHDAALQVALDLVSED
jgi:AcrR family transcriptional regulator